MSGQFVISETRPADHPEIEHLLDLSFGIGRRTKTSYRLREGSLEVDGLSLAIRDGQVGIAGAISFWPLRIGAEGTPALLLGPLAVHPERQNMGIGLALMREGLARAEAKGHRLAILVGDEPYYARVGFKKMQEGLLIMPGPVDPARMLYMEIVPAALNGVSGLVLPPHRFQQRSTAFAVPHGADGEKQGAQA